MGVLAPAWIAAAVAVIGLGIGPARPEAQDASAPELAAAYLLNFAKFTTWPSDTLPPGGTIVICVSGDDWVADSLVRLIRNRPINGQAVAIRKATLAGPFESCHLVYATNLDRNRADRLIQATATQPIVTISDSTDFAEHGGVANFFVDNGRMRFAVNPAAAIRARLQISSKLLALAKIVGS